MNDATTDDKTRIKQLDQALKDAITLLGKMNLEHFDKMTYERIKEVANGKS